MAQFQTVSQSSVCRALTRSASLASIDNSQKKRRTNRPCRPLLYWLNMQPAISASGDPVAPISQRTVGSADALRRPFCTILVQTSSPRARHTADPFRQSLSQRLLKNVRIPVVTALRLPGFQDCRDFPDSRYFQIAPGAVMEFRIPFAYNGCEWMFASDLLFR